MEHVYIVTVLALIEYAVFGGLVARARSKHGIAAPAISGNVDFERVFRVHQNTLEGLVTFLPALWLFGAYVHSEIAAILGLIWVVGRALYARGYIAAAEKRELGGMICGITMIVLLLGSLYGLIRAVM